ncbi:hypothetical protein AURDEDRAFT_188661 [Auricularia subglabra TFB-10046 SS5]|uniref:Uncharacterized protein n=1 Tax=Auricularia subglabra (strain TFB-10046 / SS5) TaxID=717982 RepID=J0WS38_AURST|nr:hypothetical protein AURDEDRAFT_188661 [Auricularia subglabra TFB-10046 SS5]
MTSLQPQPTTGPEEPPDLQEPLERLRLAITDDSSKTFEGLEAIFTFYNERVKSLASPSPKAPLFVLLYAIESITAPTMQWSSMEDLLALLAQVERERRRYMGLAQLHSLSASTVYAVNKATGAPRNVPALSQRDQEKLRRMLARDAGTRVRYRLLVMRLGEAHIRHVRARPEISHEAPALLSKYFPVPEDAPKRARELAIHADLSDEEVQQRDGMRAYVTQSVIKDASEWDQRRREFYHKLNPDFDPMQNGEFSSYTRDFEAKFPSNFAWSETRDMLDTYVERVENLAGAYEAMFPNGVYTPAEEREAKPEP